MRDFRHVLPVQGRHDLRPVLTLGLALGMSLVLAACGDKEGEDTAGGEGDPVEAMAFSEIENDVFLNSCAFSSCHGGGAGQLTLGAGTSYDALVGVEAAGVEGAILVVAGDSGSSYLVDKLNGSAGIDGDLMPPGQALDGDVIAGIAAWIDEGAANN